ncbi:MAG: hypothetical protein IJ548_04970 [Paludibacteraceae bacterium]|nr:hypothetical protein [Paludibacteraceae bacterium]
MKIIIPSATFIIMSLSFFCFLVHHLELGVVPHPKEAPTTAMPAINKYSLFSIPSKIEEIITAVVMYFAMSNSQLANLSFLLLFLFMLQR